MMIVLGSVYSGQHSQFSRPRLSTRKSSRVAQNADGGSLPPASSLCDLFRLANALGVALT
jgi:hypothetical protein